MTDIYLARLARVVPPRSNSYAVTGGGAVRAQAVTSTSASYQLDNDIFQMPLANGATVGQATPGNYGRALLRLHAEGNPVYFNTSQAAGTANSAAVGQGNTVCGRIPADQDRDYEFDPTVDKFINVATQNGQGLTATVRYQIVSFPTNTQGAG